MVASGSGLVFSFKTSRWFFHSFRLDPIVVCGDILEVFALIAVIKSSLFLFETCVVTSFLLFFKAVTVVNLNL